jgi:hypothetical protein
MTFTKLLRAHCKIDPQLSTTVDAEGTEGKS